MLKKLIYSSVCFYFMSLYLKDFAAGSLAKENNLSVGMSHEVTFNSFISENVLYCRCFY